MKQPQFKFGDKVEYVSKYGAQATIFSISSIEFQPNNSDGTGEFKYNGGFWETEIELHQEPQKKKLYAYKHKDEWLIVFGDEDYESIGQYNRVPKYDIEYPESK